MSSNIRYQYFVEGETEKKLIETLKRENKIIPGTVNVFNVIQKVFPNGLLANIAKNTIVILVFDTDTHIDSKLRENIRLLKKNTNVRDHWCIPQVKNLEDELIRATDIKQIKDLLGCQSNTDFKRDWLSEKNLVAKLNQHSFDYHAFWSSKAASPFDDIENDSHRVKKC